MKFERMAVLGTLASCGGVAFVYAVLAWFVTTTPYAGVPGATGGIDHITRNVTWIAALVPVTIFIVSHLVFAKQLANGPASLND